MRRNWYFILLSVAAEPRHGSDIVRDVLDMTDGALRLWPATLYGSLEELRADGLIDELAAPPPGESERKRYYRITPKGKRELVAETRRLGSAVALARRRLGGAS